MSQLAKANIESKQKALAINLNPNIYGTLAEIGAGQEVARFFFQAGGAAGTIAKTISAYDMTVSDSVYGRELSGRYVCESRLEKMLDKEFSQLIARLQSIRPSQTQFFAFADTVAARSFKSNQDGHGWLGVRFQHSPKAQPSDVVIHIRLLDNQNLLQQQALGRVGINLIYACFHYLDEPPYFIQSLMDSLSPDRIEIDMIRVRGPAFEKIDGRILNLELIKRHYATAVIFDADGSILQPSDTLYRKNILLLRGSFRPPTHVNLDMLEKGLVSFKKLLPPEEHKDILILPEISMSKLVERGEVDNADFLARVDLLAALGQKIMISGQENFYSLNAYISTLTKKSIAFVLGNYNLESIFDSNSDATHPFGMLAGIGQLIGKNTKLLVYAAQDPDSKKIIRARDTKTSEDTKLLLEYLIRTKSVIDIEDFNPDHLNIWSRTVLKMIQSDQTGWEKMVPQIVVDTVKAQCLFGKKC